MDLFTVYVPRKALVLYKGTNSYFNPSRPETAWFALKEETARKYGSRVTQLNCDKELRLLDVTSYLFKFHFMDQLRENKCQLKNRDYWNATTMGHRLSEDTLDRCMVAEMNEIYGRTHDGYIQQHSVFAPEVCLFKPANCGISVIRISPNQRQEYISGSFGGFGGDMFSDEYFDTVAKNLPPLPKEKQWKPWPATTEENEGKVWLEYCNKRAREKLLLSGYTSHEISRMVDKYGYIICPSVNDIMLRQIQTGKSPEDEDIKEWKAAKANDDTTDYLFKSWTLDLRNATLTLRTLRETMRFKSFIKRLSTEQQESIWKSVTSLGIEYTKLMQSESALQFE